MRISVVLLQWMHSWAKLVSLLEMPHSLPEAKIQSSFSVLFGSDFHLSILSSIQILGCYSTDVTLDIYCVCIYVSFRFLNFTPFDHWTYRTVTDSFILACFRLIYLRMRWIGTLLMPLSLPLMSKGVWTASTNANYLY